tara:strand:- start:2119 stop:2724 length:606 start_codon:yes stop_codon:yes gene_type:complete
MKIAVFISGGGTTLRNLIQQRDAGRLDVTFKRVISSNPSAAGLRFAEQAGISHHNVCRKDFPEADTYSDAMFSPCREAEVDYVLMAGFMRHVLIPDDFTHRVLNIHPALIPSFCGQGFYGRRVHEAVLSYGAKVSGCTVHFVDNQYDHGPIFLQRVVPVEVNDSPETLASRVFAAECEAYPEAIRLLDTGQVRIEGRHVTW